MTETRTRSDRGVSQSIAVLLMVAVTVVLAVVVAQPLYTMASSPTKGTQASATVEFDRGDGDGSITVEFVDNIDAEDLEVDVTVETNPGSNSVSVVGGSRDLEEPGESVTFEEDASNADEDLEVTVLVTGLRKQQRTVVLEKSGTI